MVLWAIEEAIGSMFSQPSNKFGSLDIGELLQLLHRVPELYHRLEYGLSRTYGEQTAEREQERRE